MEQSKGVVKLLCPQNALVVLRDVASQPSDTGLSMAGEPGRGILICYSNNNREYYLKVFERCHKTLCCLFPSRDYHSYPFGKDVTSLE